MIHKRRAAMVTRSRSPDEMVAFELDAAVAQSHIISVTCQKRSACYAEVDSGEAS